jgi:hypothetical protein
MKASHDEYPTLEPVGPLFSGYAVVTTNISQVALAAPHIQLAI